MNPQLGGRVGCYPGCVGCSFGCLLLLAIPAALVVGAVTLIVRKK